MRYRLPGAIAPVGLFAVSESFRQWYLATVHPHYHPLVASVTFRVGIGMIIALVAGLMARSLAREAAKATDRATLAEDAARREAAARRDLNLFHSTVLAGVVVQDLEATLQSMAQEIARDLGFEGCGIVLLEDGVLRARGAYGVLPSVREPETPLGQGAVGTVAATGQPLLVPDVRALPAPVEPASRVLSEAAVPLKFKGEMIGVLGVGTSSPDALDEGTVDLLTRLADQIALVVHSARLHESQRETVRRLQQLDRMKSDFIAITSHELRTPLTAIQGFIKTMLKNYDRLSAADMQEFLALVDRQAHRLARLVEDLLMVSRIEAGELTISPEPVAPVSFLGNLLASFGEDAARIKLHIEGEPPPSMVVDPYRVEQVLRNLLHNAMKFSPLGSPISLDVQFEDSRIDMSVADRGVGIAPEERDRIFERFQQAGFASTRQTEGAGLGLYITKQLVEAMGGSVELESEVGSGSTFTVRIPLGRDGDHPIPLDATGSGGRQAR
jgi:signal transduction histidine kinase